MDKKLKSCLSRAKKVIFSSREKLIMAQPEQTARVNNLVNDAVKMWAVNTQPALLNSDAVETNSEGSSQASNSAATLHTSPSMLTALFSTTKKKTDRRQVKRTQAYVLLRETLDAYVEMSGSTFPTLHTGEFIGQLLIHSDELVSTYVSHFLQKIVMRKPVLRYHVLLGVATMLRNIPPGQPVFVYYVLRNLLLLLDLWIASWYTWPKSQYGGRDAGTLLADVVITIEAVALEHLCHPSTEIRTSSMDLLDSVYVLCHMHSRGGEVLYQRERKRVE